MLVQRGDEALPLLRRDPRDALDFLGTGQDRLERLAAKVADKPAGQRLADSGKEPAREIGDDRRGLTGQLAQGMKHAKLRPPLRVRFPLAAKSELVARGDGQKLPDHGNLRSSLRPHLDGRKETRFVAKEHAGDGALQYVGLIGRIAHGASGAGEVQAPGALRPGSSPNAIRIFRAPEGPMPRTATRVPSSAEQTPRTLPNRSSRAAAREGPTPGRPWRM